VIAHLLCFGYLFGFPIVMSSLYTSVKSTTETWGWSNEYFWAVVGILNTLLA
jgi:sterol desaturase/sphingolipid hydroxylase (fatty acid hydroxylase superfamily)